MNKSKFTEAQTAFTIKQRETTFCNWKKKYSGLGMPESRRLRPLEEENTQLKKLVADLGRDNQMLRDVLKKVLKPVQLRKMVGRLVSDMLFIFRLKKRVFQTTKVQLVIAQKLYKSAILRHSKNQY